MMFHGERDEFALQAGAAEDFINADEERPLFPIFLRTENMRKIWTEGRLVGEAGHGSRFLD